MEAGAQGAGWVDRKEAGWLGGVVGPCVSRLMSWVGEECVGCRSNEGKRGWAAAKGGGWMG